MVNWIEIGIVFVVIFTGIALSWLVSETARLTGWRLPQHPGGGFQRFGLADWLMAVFAGPRYLIRVSWTGWRHGEFATGLAALTFVVACGWAALLGVVVLELAFFGGYVLT